MLRFWSSTAVVFFMLSAVAAAPKINVTEFKGKCGIQMDIFVSTRVIAKSKYEKGKSWPMKTCVDQPNQKKAFANLAGSYREVLRSPAAELRLKK